MALLTSEQFIGPNGLAWRDVAACRDTDPELFFPVGTTGPAVDQIASAKVVCNMCRSREQCLQFALDTNQDTGVWGGLSEEERRTIRRARLAEKKAAKEAALAEEAARAQDTALAG